MTRKNFYAMAMMAIMMMVAGNGYAQPRGGMGHGGGPGHMGGNRGGQAMTSRGGGHMGGNRGGNMGGGYQGSYNHNVNNNVNVNVNHNNNNNFNHGGNPGMNNHGGNPGMNHGMGPGMNNHGGNPGMNHGMGPGMNNHGGNLGMNNHGMGPGRPNGNMHIGHNPRLDNRGFVHGWEGRVRHDNGRWGYYRDNRWYWYDRYFEPDYYFANPLGYFNDYYYMADGGYIPGWEGRVMYRGGRWGYLRGNDWYWYDRYYEPEYYFANPVSHFHGHRSPVGHVVAGVAGAVVLGTLISALCH